MKLPRRNFLHLATGAAALPAVSRIARAQAYPARPVKRSIPTTMWWGVILAEAVYEAARVHHGAWQRGSVAARGARAAVCNAGDRIPQERSGQVISQVLFGELAKFIGNGPGYSQHD
jgi:hypothetical protein